MSEAVVMVQSNSSFNIESVSTDEKKTRSTGLKAALNILEKWSLTNQQMMSILGLKKSQFFKAKSDPFSLAVSNDLLERISLVLNIHGVLRTVFNNPELVYGFMTSQNHNTFFEGRAPIDVIEGGNFGSLYDVYHRVNALRGGHWQ
ncbi:conserved hypothetical protein [Vibrio nigripulchritudo MADA3029]|nr:conserved hypothetical protein [Vibrio nigripulchritudo MADA3021]CCN56787.1 conserved hypothetical protein [Vibrio nigripulchritudo MADA3029]